MHSYIVDLTANLHHLDLCCVYYTYYIYTCTLLYILNFQSGKNLTYQGSTLFQDGISLGF